MFELRSNFVLEKGEEGRCCVAPLKFFILKGGAESLNTNPNNYIFLYILRSIRSPERLYIGLTKDVAERSKEHNAGSSKYSKAYAPWGIEAYIGIKDKKIAQDLERYFKSGSGFAFLKKRLVPKLKSDR